MGDCDNQKMVGLSVFVGTFQSFCLDQDRGSAEIKRDAQDVIDVVGIAINSCNFTDIFNSDYQRAAIGVGKGDDMVGQSFWFLAGAFSVVRIIWQEKVY